MFDFDDIIQYHAKNLYYLFYKRKGQEKTYKLLSKHSKCGRHKIYRTTEEKIKMRRERQKRYYWENIEKTRERNREKARRYRLKKKQEAK